VLSLFWAVQAASAATASFIDQTWNESGYVVVGDTVLHQITGAAVNKPVTYDWTYNGVFQGNFSAGTTNGSGTFSLGGGIAGGLEGFWIIKWYVNGVAVSPTISFQIAASVPSATEQNVTRGGTNIINGETIKYTVSSGFKTAPVTYDWSVNGASGTQGQTGVAAGTTDANGAYIFQGVVQAGLEGNWTVRYYVGGVPSNQLAFQVQLPVSCTGVQVSPSWMGNVTTVSTFKTVQVTGVPNSVSSVKLLGWNETQNIAQATNTTISLNTAGTVRSTWQGTIATGTSLGSYGVAAQVTGPGGTFSCTTKPGYYGVVDDANLPPPPGLTSCNSLAGTWIDDTNTTFTLTQSGGNITGSATPANNACGTHPTYSVTGTVAQNNQISLTASNPNPATLCAINYHNPVQVTALTISTANACTNGSGTASSYYNGVLVFGPSPTTFTSTAIVPTGEQSQAMGWDTNGYSTQQRFKGVLTSPANGAKFGGRIVKEAGQSFSDGCNNMTGTQYLTPVTNNTLNSTWNVQLDNSYQDDMIGYSPSVTRYYQTYALNGAGSCSLTGNQLMSIRVGAITYSQYATNSVSVTVNPSSLSVTRGNATGTKNPYPVQ